MVRKKPADAPPATQPLPQAPTLAQASKKPWLFFRWFVRLSAWFIRASLKKKIAFIGGVLAALAILFVAVFLGVLTYNSFVGEDLSLFLKASTDTLEVTHGQEGSFSFTLSARNLALCTAYCSWNVTDGASGAFIAYGEGELEGALEQNISVVGAAKGRSVVPYQVQVSCQNTVTRTCKSRGFTRQAASITLVRVGDSQTEAEARALVEQEAPAFLEQLRTLLAALNGIAAVDDPRIMIRFAARDEARAAHEQLTQLRNAAAADDPLAAAKLLAFPQAPSLQAYTAAVATEQQLIVRYQQLNRTLAQELFMVLPEQETHALNQSITELNSALSRFNVTNFTELEQRIDVVAYLLQPQPQLAIAKANAAIDVLNAQQLALCVQQNLTCTPQAQIFFSNESIRALAVACIDLQNVTQPTNETTAFIAANCTWQRANFAPVPSPLLPVDPRVDEALLPIQFPEPQCCSLGVCAACVEQQRYPVLFVHGHSFVDSTTPEDNLNAFTRMAFALQKNNYLYAGHVFPREDLNDVSFGDYKMLPSGTSFTTTYFYNSYPEEGKTVFVAIKNDNLETYALRLREAISVVKQRTGADKVVIVSHSMGGLVSRRYLQIFGEQDVSALVMIGTPNHGTSGTTQHLCAFFGDADACADMRQGSLFLTKLNNGKQPTIPLYTIAGRCKGKTTDGVIEVASVYLSGANNTVIDSDCTDGNLFHSVLLYPEITPQVFGIVQNVISQQGPAQ